MDEIRIRKGTAIILSIALGLLLLVVCAIRPRTLYEMHKAALYEFQAYMGENEVDTSLFEGPTLNLKYSGFIDFEWYSKDYTQDSLIVGVRARSSWIGGQAAFISRGDVWRDKYVGSEFRKKANSR
jgi:hypothetical protein